MIMNRTIRHITMFAAVLVWSLFMSGNALAHCDTMDGPVVRAAKQALKTGNINYVLIWVRQKDEAEIRQAFRQTLTVRRLNRAARDLADRYFFETLVRIHRAGEGQSYTGLKPAGTDLGPVIPVADKSLENGEIAALLKLFPESAKPEIANRFNDAIAKKNFNHNDVEAGRHYVAAYTSFLEYLEHLYEGRSLMKVICTSCSSRDFSRYRSASSFSPKPL